LGASDWNATKRPSALMDGQVLVGGTGIGPAAEATGIQSNPASVTPTTPMSGQRPTP
jgi:hypothetical protein